MIRYRSIYPTLILFLLLSCRDEDTRNFLLPYEYQRLLGTLPLSSAEFRTDSGRGRTITLPLQYAASRNMHESEASGCKTRHFDTWDEENLSVGAPLPGLVVGHADFSSVAKFQIISYLKDRDISSGVQRRAYMPNGPSILVPGDIVWASPSYEGSDCLGLPLEHGQAVRFDTLRDSAGQYLNSTMTVKTLTDTVPARNPTGIYGRFLIAREARFDRLVGLTYLHYHWYDSLGLPHEEKLLRTQ